MKKLRWIILIFMITLMVILTVPFQVTSYDDGKGKTKAYRSVTYQYVKWNRFYHDDLCYNSPRIYFGKRKNKSIDELWKEIVPDSDLTEPQQTQVPAQQEERFTAVVKDVGEREVRIVPKPDSWLFQDGSEIVIPKQITATQGQKDFPELKVGNEIEVVFDGLVCETYPAQIRLLYDIIVLEEAQTAQLTKISTPDEKVSLYDGTVHLLQAHSDFLRKASYPYTKVLSNVSELYEVRNQLQRYENELQKYDEAFFAEKSLLLIVTQEGSGSITYEDVSVKDCTVTLKRVRPEVSTCDLAYWYIITEIEKDSPIIEKGAEICIIE